MISLVERSFQEKTNKYVNEINTFLRERGKEVTSKDRNISIINLQSGQFYSLNNDNYKKLFDILEDARKNSAKTTYAEYQKTPSAISIDLLFKHCFQEPVKLNSLNAFLNKICEYTIAALPVQDADELPSFLELRIARKQGLIPTDKVNQSQEWYRIVINNIHTGSIVKSQIIADVIKDKVLERTFARELGAVRNFQKIIDTIELRDLCIVESVSVLGSGEVPFIAHSAYKYDTYDHTLQKFELDDAVNICAEYSVLCAQNAYKFIHPEEQQEEDEKNNAVVKEDLELLINQINEEKIQSDVLLYKNILDILEPYKEDRDKWETIIAGLARSSQMQPALAGEHDRHWLLAQWFTIGSPFESVLSTVWEANKDKPRGHTKRKLIFMAKELNINLFQERLKALIVDKLCYFATQYDGHIENGMVATLIYLMLCDRYVVDIGDSAKGQDYCWYEFVMPNMAMKKGEIYKWRKELEPDEIYIFIRYELNNIYKDVERSLIDKLDELDEDDDRGKKQIKRIGRLLNNFKTSASKLFVQNYVAGIIKSATYNFRIRGFTEVLDTCGEAMGVGNGVLLLRKMDVDDRQVIPRLVTGFHEFEISRFTPIDYEPVDWDAFYVKLMLDAIRGIFIEDDVFEFIMCFIASSLDGLTKAAMILFLYGVGSNGKSFFLELVKSTLGDEYAKKFSLSLLTEPREASEKPNSAFMSLKNARFGYYSEPNKSETINTGRLKEMLGQETQSGRDLHKKQENFRIVANQVAASNWPLIIDCSDHGTWRRIRYYTCKTKFVKDPDTQNKHERPVNKDFIEKYKDDPRCQKAFLSILVHYYSVLQTKYDGDLDKISTPTISAETEDYRNSQDMVNQYINKHLEKIDDSSKLIPITEVATNFISWLTDIGVNGKGTQVPIRDAIAQLENSRLNAFLVRRNGVLALRNHKLLDALEIRDREVARMQ